MFKSNSGSNKYCNWCVVWSAVNVAFVDIGHAIAEIEFQFLIKVVNNQPQVEQNGWIVP